VLVAEPAAYYCLRFRLEVGSLIGAFLLFFVPLSLLAMVGPFFARLIATAVQSVGRTVGQLTALSTLGSVAGTVLVGYVLIPRAANSVTMYGCAAACCCWRWSISPPGSVPAWYGGRGGRGGWLLRPGGRDDLPLAPQPGWRELYRGNSNSGMLQVIESVDGSGRTT
jgi:hypothetical protein